MPYARRGKSGGIQASYFEQSRSDRRLVTLPGLRGSRLPGSLNLARAGLDILRRRSCRTWTWLYCPGMTSALESIELPRSRPGSTNRAHVHRFLTGLQPQRACACLTYPTVRSRCRWMAGKPGRSRGHVFAQSANHLV